MGDISYEPVIRDMTWSYSRVKTFEMCPYMWYLKYIQKLPAKNLFFSSYGSFVHELLEQYYKGELAHDQLLFNYLTGFRSHVIEAAPNAQIFSKYFQDGVVYFKEFKPVPYKPVGVEERIDGDIDGLKCTGFIDFMSEDDDGIVIIDNKSRQLKPRSNRPKPLKSDIELDQYYIQLYLYAKLVEQKYQKPISCLGFNCFRCKPPLIMEPYVQEKSDFAVNWLKENVARITKETDFNPDMDYFKCKHLCDMQDQCEYYQMTFGR